MFDELDDPAFAGAGAGTREAVAARAASIRRRRRAAWAGSGTSLVLVVAALAYGMRSASPNELAVVTEGTPSATVSPTEATTPPTSPAPTGTPSPDPSTPSPTWRVITDSVEDLYPGDGRPGWSNGGSSCQDLTRMPDPGAAPFEAVSLRLELPSATLQGGKVYAARLVVRNRGTERVRFLAKVPGDHDTRALDSAGHGSAVHGGDARVASDLDLGPGEEREFDVRVVTWSCADAYYHPAVPLPPGTYSMTAGFAWTVDPNGPRRRDGEWNAPVTRVTITE